MSCINCEEFAKRITNIFRDEDLKSKFENLTGLNVFRNIFICEICEKILLSSYQFKEKCTEVYEKGLIKYDPIEKSMTTQDKNDEVSTETILLLTEDDEGTQIYSIEASKDNSQLLHEDHDCGVEETKDEINEITFENRERKLRLRYTFREKMRAIEIAEQSSNRQAAKQLSIDESCIRKWRHQKEKIKANENQNGCKLRKKTKLFEANTEEDDVSEIGSFNAVECEIQTTEIVSELMEEEGEETSKAKEFKTRRAYSSAEKLEVVAFAEVTGNRQAAKVFKIDESCIRKWRNRKSMLIEINNERGLKRKSNLRFPQLESRLKSFVIQKMEEGVFLRPSEIKEESMRIAKELNIDNFKGTSSYIFKFMERYRIPSKGKKRLSQNIS